MRKKYEQSIGTKILKSWDKSGDQKSDLSSIFKRLKEESWRNRGAYRRCTRKVEDRRLKKIEEMETIYYFEDADYAQKD